MRRDVQVVSNSYGSSGPEEFNPDGSLEVATWESFKQNVLPVFSAGNSGPGTNTLNAYTKAPHVLGVAANKDDKTVTDFSSRGRKPSYDGETNYDRKEALGNLETYYESGDAAGPLGIYRDGVGAPGNAVMSTMNPNDPLQGLNPDDEPYYAAISGTPMSCPGIAGIATLVIDAARQNGEGTPDSIDVLKTIEATADERWTVTTPGISARASSTPSMPSPAPRRASSLRSVRSSSSTTRAIAPLGSPRGSSRPFSAVSPFVVLRRESLRVPADVVLHCIISSSTGVSPIAPESLTR